MNIWRPGRNRPNLLVHGEPCIAGRSAVWWYFAADAEHYHYNRSNRCVVLVTHQGVYRWCIEPSGELYTPWAVMAPLPTGITEAEAKKAVEVLARLQLGEPG